VVDVSGPHGWDFPATNLGRVRSVNHSGPTLIPYALAYVAYRAAVSAADEFMTAVSTIIDFDRFALYRHLGLRRPRTTHQERRRNEKLMLLLQNEPTDPDEPEVSLTYAPEEPPDKA